MGFSVFARDRIPFLNPLINSANEIYEGSNRENNRRSVNAKFAFLGIPDFLRKPRSNPLAGPSQESRVENCFCDI